MKLFEATGEEAVVLLADLIMPVLDLTDDADVVGCFRTGQKLKGIRLMMKNHPRAVLELLAICEGIPVEEYKPTAVVIPIKLLQILNHPDVSQLFFTQVQTGASSSLPAMETTTGAEK